MLPTPFSEMVVPIEGEGDEDDEGVEVLWPFLESKSIPEVTAWAPAKRTL